METIMVQGLPQPIVGDALEVLPCHLVDQNVWARFLTGTAAVTLSIKDTAEALTMFGWGFVPIRLCSTNQHTSSHAPAT